MNRVATILIVFAMTVTAVSVAVVLAVQFAFPPGQAIASGASVLFALALLHVQIERRRDRRWMEARVSEIAAVAGDVNTEVGRVAAKLAKVDATLPAHVREETEPLVAEVEVLGHLMKQIADTLADFEIRVDEQMGEIAAKGDTPRLSGPPQAPSVQTRLEPREERSAERQGEPIGDSPFSVHPPVRPEPIRAAEPARIPTAFEREVEAAIRAERIEIHLQPIVTLPQRKVRYYEVLTRLRAADERLIAAAEFLPAAEARRLIARLDTYQVIRSFQILKRLTARNREIGLTVNISPLSLVDTGFYREFSAFLNQNRSMADLVQFEFTQAAVREMGPLEAESLAALADIGYRFSVDTVTDLRMDFRGLVDQGFRTVKISVDRLLGRAPMITGDIHPADLSGHLQRQGIALVVDRIETEAQVVDLLDYDVRLAQGFLFSAPRQVRPEILGAAPAADAAKSKAAGR
ncbi:MAG TPA: EAL domain-containing protein [Methylomirabilota bacterium]|nr:EAL domain-containing protein [Methylomirabilota bacterium]